MNILDILGDRPIAYHPRLARLCGSVNAGVFLGQMLYWWARRTGDTVYKTSANFEEETCLGRREQDEAIKKLKTLGVLSVKLAGIPATRHFTINEKVLLEALSCQTGCTQTPNLMHANAKLDARKRQTNTESTTESTTQSTDIPPTPLRGEERVSNSLEYSTSFEKWWNAYPSRNGSKNGKTPSWKKWQTLRDLPPIDDLLKILEVHKQSKKWKDGFNPDPHKWLNQKCWLDEVEAHVPSKEERDKFLIAEYYKLRFDKFADKYGYEEGHRIDGLVEDIELSKSPRHYD